MRKSFLQSVGDTVSGQIFGMDVHDPMQKEESGSAEFPENVVGPNQRAKSAKEKNKRL